MLCLLVTAQVNFALESPTTQVTGKRFEARVLAAVGDQVRGLTEGFPADLTLVRLLTCNQKDILKIVFKINKYV